MKFAFILLFIVDLTVGILFGLIGHFYAILTFPLIALVRGYLGMRKNYSFKDAAFFTFFGSVIFFVGLMIGVIVNSMNLNSQLSVMMIKVEDLSKAINLSVFTGFIYFLIYNMLGLLSAYLCTSIVEVKKISRQENASKKEPEDI
jgi:hypothetical protein